MGFASAGGIVLHREATTGILSVRSGGTNLEIAACSEVLPSGQWLRICIAWDWTSVSVNSGKVWVNGVQVASWTNQSFPQPGAAVSVGSGYGTPNSPYDMYSSDVYVDDSSSLTDLGEVRCTHKYPVANTDSGFDTLVGAGADRYVRVAEVPFSDSNGISHVGTSVADETFAIQAESDGEVNLANATKIAHVAYARVSRGYFDYELVSWIAENSSKVTAHTTTVLSLLQSSPASAGAAIIVVFACDDNGNPGTTPTCTDSQGNSYSLVRQEFSTGSATGVRTAMFVALNITALTMSDTITITHASVNASAAGAYGVPGAVTSSIVEVDAGQTQSGTTAHTTPTASSVASTDVLWCGVVGWEGVLADRDIHGFSSSLNLTTKAQVSAGTSGGGAASNMSVNSRLASVTTTDGRSFYTDTFSNRDSASIIAAFKMQSAAMSAGSPKFIARGVAYDRALGVSAGIGYMVFDSSDYPTEAAAVGLRSSGSSADTFLYECGFLFAYKASTFQHLPVFGRRRQIDVRV